MNTFFVKSFKFAEILQQRSIQYAFHIYSGCWSISFFSRIFNEKRKAPTEGGNVEKFRGTPFPPFGRSLHPVAWTAALRFPRFRGFFWPLADALWPKKNVRYLLQTNKKFHDGRRKREKPCEGFGGQQPTTLPFKLTMSRWRQRPYPSSIRFFSGRFITWMRWHKKLLSLSWVLGLPMGGGSYLSFSPGGLK